MPKAKKVVPIQPVQATGKAKVKSVVDSILKEQIVGGGAGTGDRVPFLPKFVPDQYYNIRIAPPHEAMETIWVRHVWHAYGPQMNSHAFKIEGQQGGKMLTCLEAHGKDECPVCQVKRYATEEDNEQIANILQTTTKFLMNVYSRDTKSWAIWSATPGVAKQIQQLVMNPQIGDITDPNKGYDLSVMLTSTRPQRYIVTANPNRCAIGVSDWKEKIQDLNRFLVLMEPIEMVKILNYNLGHLIDLREVFGDVIQPPAPKPKRGKK